MGLVAALIWAKAILMTEYTRTFGPILKILIVMTKKMLTFLVLWGIILIFFLCIGMLLFPDVT
jgi:hypothetical protein